MTSSHTKPASPDCEFCHGAGFVLSPVDGWHSTDKQLREPCPCTDVVTDDVRSQP